MDNATGQQTAEPDVSCGLITDILGTVERHGIHATHDAYAPRSHADSATREGALGR